MPLLEFRPGVIAGREAVQNHRALISRLDGQVSNMPAGLDDRAAVIKSIKPENIALRQAVDLNDLVDNGVQDLIIGIALELRPTHPDVKVRVTKPTGRLFDPMAIMLEFGHFTHGGVETLRRFSAFPRPYDYDRRDPAFGISRGPLSLLKEHVIITGNGEDTYIPYSDPDALGKAARKLAIYTAGRYSGQDESVRLLHPGGSNIFQRLNTPQGEFEPFIPAIEVELPVA